MGDPSALYHKGPCARAGPDVINMDLLEFSTDPNRRTEGLKERRHADGGLELNTIYTRGTAS